MTLRTFVERRPVLTAVGCAALQFLLTVLILKAGIAFAPPEAFGKVKLVAFASTVLLPLVLVQVLGLWRQVGLKFDSLRPAPIFLVSLLSCVLFLSMGVHRPEHSSFGVDVLMQFVNAFGEELLFRGVIFALLLRLPKWKAIALCGISFGCMHLIHGFMDGDWSAALAQAAITACAGMMFTAVRYETGSLWLTVLLHMLLNLSMIYSGIALAAGPDALFAVQRLANVFELLLTAYVLVTPTPRTALEHGAGGADPRIAS